MTNVGLDHAAIVWSSWYALDSASRNRAISRRPGLYRIRRAGTLYLDYVGQTSNLRRRMGHLNGVYGDLMPYNDPHTAGPGLWALRQNEDCDFEVSVAEVPTENAARKGYECLLISEHRVEHRCSPTLNFGRMPNGWIKSNNKRARLRGRRDSSVVRIPDVAPPVTLEKDVRAMQWHGLDWSRESFAAGSTGVYRAMRSGDDGLIYVGKGRIKDRIKSHLNKGNDPEHRQHRFFAVALDWQFVDLPNMHPTQLLEIENDLIASHVLAHGHPPKAQFLG